MKDRMKEMKKSTRWDERRYVISCCVCSPRFARNIFANTSWERRVCLPNCWVGLGRIAGLRAEMSPGMPDTGSAAAVDRAVQPKRVSVSLIPIIADRHGCR